MLLLAAAGSLLSRPHSHLAAGVATGLTAALVLAAVAHSRLRRETVAPVAMALTGCTYAGLAGLLLGSGALPGTSLAAAGGGMLVVAVLAAIGLAEGRALLLPAVVVGVVLLSTGLLVRAVQADQATLLTAALAGVVVSGSVFPALALAATGTQVPPPGAPADIACDPGPVDAEVLSADARVAHEIMVAMSATVGILLVLVAPAAVSLGVAGTVVPLLGCLVVTLRTRQCHSAADVLVGLVSAVLGLMSTATSVLWLHPDWRLPAALGLAAGRPRPAPRDAAARALADHAGTPRRRRRVDGPPGHLAGGGARDRPPLLGPGPGGLMATRRDLAQAHAFDRRRLVTAFRSGAPGGREVEPAHTGRALAGGVGLGLLLIGAAVVRGVLTGPPGPDPHDSGSRRPASSPEGLRHRDRARWRARACAWRRAGRRTSWRPCGSAPRRWPNHRPPAGLCRSFTRRPPSRRRSTTLSPGRAPEVVAVTTRVPPLRWAETVRVGSSTIRHRLLCTPWSVRSRKRDVASIGGVVIDTWPAESLTACPTGRHRAGPRSMSTTW